MLSKGDSAESSDDETSDILDSLTECIQKGQTKISSVYNLHPKNEPYKQSEVFDLQISKLIIRNKKLKFDFSQATDQQTFIEFC